MTRAIRHGFLKDESRSVCALREEDHGIISQHLRNHVHLTNCIHLKNHMHRHSPIQAERSLMKDLVVLQRSKSLRDPSTSPPSWLSPFVVATLLKRSGKDSGIHSGRRSVAVDAAGEVSRLSVNHSKTAGLASFNVSPLEDRGSGRENRDEETRKREDGMRSNLGDKASHSSLLGQNPRLKTLSEQLDEIPSQTDNDIRKPSRLCHHRGQRGCEKSGKELKTSGHGQFSGSSRTKRRKLRGGRRSHGSVDLRDCRVHNDMHVPSTSFVPGFTNHEYCLGEEEEEFEENVEMDVTQAPRHGCGIPWNWSRIHHRGKTFLDIAGRSLACGLSESRLRKDAGSCRHSQKENDSSKIPITSQLLNSSTGSDSEALPFLLDPSGSPQGNSNPRMSRSCSGELGIYTNNSHHELDSDPVSEARSSNQHTSRRYCKSRHQNLTQKYMPKTFKDIVGQSLVVQALSNAVSRRKVGLIYVFYGPHGTGKTSSARVFAKSLNCQSDEHFKPCDLCASCMSHNMGKSRNLLELGAVSTFDAGRIMDALNNAMLSTSTSQYKVFIVDDGDNLSPDLWMAISKVAHRAPRHVVFILISSSLDHLPHLIISRCQKFYFPKVKESDIIHTLQWISTSEGLEIDKDALKLIASRSDGSLRDAEMTLDQLSLLGQRISLPLVQELVGLVSDEKLVDLLDVALSADTVDTIKSLREIIEAGVEPLALMSQLATLITDILAGSYVFTKERLRRKFFRHQTLSREEMEKLRQALRTLSEAEKNLRVSNDKLTWLTAALLQIVPDQHFTLTSFDNNLNQTPLLVNVTDERIDVGNTVSGGDEAFYSDSQSNRNLRLDSQRQRGIISANSKIANNYIKREEHLEHTPNGKDTQEAFMRLNVSTKDNLSLNFGRRCKDYGKIWQEVIESIQPDALKQFLSQEGKLSSVLLGSAPTVQLVFGSSASKSKAERFRAHILQAFSSVLNANIILEIRCNPQMDVTKDAHAQDTNNIDEPDNVSSRMMAIQRSMSNHNSYSQQPEYLLRQTTKESTVKGNGSRLVRELQSLAMGRDRKGKGSEFVWAGEGSSLQQYDQVATLSGRKDYEEQSNSKSLVKGKVSLAHVIQQAEGCASHSGWSRHRAISITEKLEHESMRLESRSRSLLCWKGSRATRSKLFLSRNRTKNSRSLLKLVPCGRCLSSKSAR